MDKTYARCKDRFHWPTMYRDIRDYCRACIGCATRKRPLHYNKAKLRPITVNAPWEMVGCDIIGPLTQTVSGNRNIIVFCDYLTGFTEAFATPDATAETVGKLYVEEIVCRFGAARSLRTDQGPQYIADLTKRILALCGTEHRLSPPYAPWCNGKVERQNAVLIDTISQYTNGTDWDQYLPYAIFASNTAIHASTKQSPYFLMFGRDAQLPIDSVFEYRRPIYAEEQSLPESIMESFAKIYAQTRDNIEKAQAHQKRNYDKNAQDPEIQVGDLVLLRDVTEERGPKRKFAHKWKQIHRVVKLELPDLILKRVDKPGEPNARIHINNVKLYRAITEKQNDQVDHLEPNSDGSVEY